MIERSESHIKNASKAKKETFNPLKKYLEMATFGHQQFLRYQLSWTAVNCWHENDQESAAMWQLYLASNEGVAIETSFKRMSNSFAGVQEDVYIGHITYIDHEKEKIPLGNTLYPLVTKRKSFQHEREVRAVIWRGLAGTNQLCDTKAPNPWGNHGELVPVDMNLLIKTVYLAPGSPEWFVDIVQDVISRYGLKKPVKSSKIDEDPVF